MNITLRRASEVKSDNFNCVTIGSLHLYFSYETIIGFGSDNMNCVSENLWGTTTGKHINMIDDNKANRLPREEFERVLQEEIALTIRC